MNVSLTPEFERMVAEKVNSGLYTSASEVVREALRLLRERDQLRELRLEGLRKEVRRGVDQLDRGQSKPFDPATIKTRARAKPADRNPRR